MEFPYERARGRDCTRKMGYLEVSKSSGSRMVVFWSSKSDLLIESENCGVQPPNKLPSRGPVGVPHQTLSGSLGLASLSVMVSRGGGWCQGWHSGSEPPSAPKANGSRAAHPAAGRQPAGVAALRGGRAGVAPPSRQLRTPSGHSAHATPRTRCAGFLGCRPRPWSWLARRPAARDSASCWRWPPPQRTPACALAKPRLPPAIPRSGPDQGLGLLWRCGPRGSSCGTAARPGMRRSPPARLGTPTGENMQLA